MNAIRKSVLALCAFGLMLSAAAAVKKPSLEPRWSGANQAEWTMDRAAALANAKADGRWTLVLLTGAWWCPWCQPVEEKVFNTEAWNDYAVANGYYEVQTDYPARDGKSRPCWLWDKGFQEKNGITPEEAASNVVERLKYQADIVKKLPGTYPCEKMGPYHADNTVVQIDWSDFDHPQTNRWESYAPSPYFDYQSDVGYGTVFVYAPTGELVGRFPSAVRDGYDENKDALPGKVWTEAEAFAQITNRIEKAKGGKSYVRVSVDSECEEMGSVTEVDKLFAKGATVTLKAKAKSGYVFAGWYAYGIPLTDFSFDYRTASASFKADGKDRIITAQFAAKSDDKYITISCEPEDGYSVTNAMSLPVSVSSRSLPTVTAKPLPDGLKLVAPSAANGWRATITGTPKKPSQEVTTTITVKNASATSSKNIVLRIWDKRSNLLPELKNDEGYTFIPGDKPDMTDVLGEATMAEITTNTNWSVSGLPDGMKFDAKKREFTGVPTKASKSYVVTFTLKSGKTTVDYATVVFRTTAFPVTKLEAWFDYLNLDPVENEIKTNGVKLTGGKACAANTKLSLSATAPKAEKNKDSWVFAGWYAEKGAGDSRLWNGTQDWRLASKYTFVSLTNEVTTLYARFVPKSKDGAVKIACVPDPYYYVKTDMSLAVDVESFSKPTVTMKPLPKGMTFNANTLKVTGKPTKDGEEQTAIITVKNVAGAKATASVVLKVKDLETATGLTMLKYNTGYTFIPGDKDLENVLGSELLNELGLGGWTLSGLPAGMKWDSKNNTITGAATKALTSYTVTFTSKADKNDKATVTFRTSAFPETRLEAWFDYLGQEMDEISTNGVKLTGGKACAAGTVLKLTAKAPKAVKARKDEWVFAGWYAEKDTDCALDNGKQDWRLASSYQFTSLTNDLTTLYARFVPKSLDGMVEIVCEDGYDFTANAQTSVCVRVNSYSKPTVAAMPLPKGMKWDASLLAFTGKPTVPGDSKTCVIKAYNATVGKSAVETRAVALHVLDQRSDNLPMLKYDEGYDFIPGDTDLEAVLGSELLKELGLGGWTLSGLPAGMKWDSKNNTITGAATKALTSYTVTFTSKTDKKDKATVSFRTMAFPETKLEAWFDYQGVSEDEIPTNGVKLTGGKACAANTKLSLSATAPKAEKNKDSWVFAGWYAEKGNLFSALRNGTQDWRTASKYTFMSLTNELTVLYARFVPKSMDVVNIALTSDASEAYDPNTNMAPFRVDVASDSLVKSITWSGYPKGMSFAQDKPTVLGGNVSGKPTEPGYYTTTFKVTNQSGSRTFDLDIRVNNIFSAELDGLLEGGLQDSYAEFTPGVSPACDLRFANLYGTDWKVSGLPGSMKLVDGVFSGAPDKPGRYTVWFKKYKGKTVVDTATATFEVGPAPELRLVPLVLDEDAKIIEPTPAGFELSGAGRFPANSTTPVSATTTDPDYVFVGWYDSATNVIITSGDEDFRNSSKFPCPVTEELVDGQYVTTVYGVFMPKSLDWLTWVEMDFEALEFKVNTDASTGDDDGLVKRVDSGSQPVFTATGLPAGLKIDPKTLLITGKPTKKGSSIVKMDIKNGSGFTYTTWVPINVVDEYFTSGIPDYPVAVTGGDDPFEYYVNEFVFSLLFVGDSIDPKTLPFADTLVEDGKIVVGCSAKPSGLPSTLDVGYEVTSRTNTTETTAKVWNWWLAGMPMTAEKRTVKLSGVYIDELTGKTINAQSTLAVYIRDSPSYWLHVKADGGQVSGGNCVVKPGKKLTLSATPDGERTFVGWYQQDAEGQKTELKVPGSKFDSKVATPQTIVVPAGAMDGEPVTWYAVFE